MQKKYLTPAQVVERWDSAVCIGTLANWRSKKRGPPFQKFGSSVRYPIASLETWEAQNKHGANDNQQNTEPAKDVAA